MNLLSVSVFRTSDGLLNQLLIKSNISVKSMFATTVSKTKVLLRALLSRSSGHYITGWETVSSDLKTRIVSQTTDNRLNQSSALNKLLNRLFNGQKVLINRLIWRRSETNFNPKAIIGSTGLSLGLVGVCVRRDGPTLITETDLMEINCQEIQNVFNSYRSVEFQSKPLDLKDLSLNDIEFGECIAKGCNGVVYSANIKDMSEQFAIKMLFNFEAESNATDVWKALNKECLPFAGDFAPEGQLMANRPKLVSHPNIVDILGVFVDQTPQLDGALHLYPDALPARMGGYARNMTLFIVEKRYDLSLKQYLSAYEPTTNTSTVLLTQLLEAISFLGKNSISHRDIKTDNILLTLNQSTGMPWLVLTDFGLSVTSLRLPFPCDEVCRGGNRALMAPEIICAKSGIFEYLDYTSSDVWAVGAIAYEIFNGLNPFYSYPQRKHCLQSASYVDSELPAPPESMPPLLAKLILSFLSRNANKRTDSTIGANVCQILLHMSPSLLHKLLTTNDYTQRTKQLIHWLKTLSMTTIARRRTQFDSNLLKDIEFKLRVLFLSQVKIQHLNKALDFIAGALH